MGHPAKPSRNYVLALLDKPGAELSAGELMVLFGVSRGKVQWWARSGKFGAFQTEKKHARGHQWAFQAWLVKRELAKGRG